MAWSYLADGCVQFFKRSCCWKLFSWQYERALPWSFSFHHASLIHALGADFHFYIQGSSPFLGKQNSLSLSCSLSISLSVLVHAAEWEDKTIFFINLSTVTTIGKRQRLSLHYTQASSMFSHQGRSDKSVEAVVGGSMPCSSVPHRPSYYHQVEELNLNLT